ncbi:hypothetical protein E1283_13970 [Streptomyces hainanensis]|uniref:Uncharacterized protein n=1 Tax=Streptomyces hainanensis TaxID=402648 RepID=A0A4R4TH44_9ACTN|nr:hypothetical protein E1283_13970 [Streptomyces hainanensis]
MSGRPGSLPAGRGPARSGPRPRARRRRSVRRSGGYRRLGPARGPRPDPSAPTRRRHRVRHGAGERAAPRPRTGPHTRTVHARHAVPRRGHRRHGQRPEPDGRLHRGRPPRRGGRGR